MSANHNQSFDEAGRIIHAAKEAGADAIKLQTYTLDTLTIDSDNEFFRIKSTIWEGETELETLKPAELLMVYELIFSLKGKMPEQIIKEISTALFIFTS